MGRGIRPIKAFGEDGLRASLELAESMGLGSETLRTHYADYYDEYGKLVVPEGKSQIFGSMILTVENMPTIVTGEVSEINYYQSEFDI